MIPLLAIALAISPVKFLREVHPGGAAAIVGLAQTGKSRLVKEASLGFRRLVVFDPYGQRDRLELARGKKVWPWRGDLWTVAELLDNPGALDVDPCRVIVDPGNIPREKLGLAFTHVANLCWHTGDLDVVAEEASLYSREAGQAILQLTSGGGHAGIRLYVISQSMGMVTIFAARHLTHVVSFSQSDVSDFKNLAARCGQPFADLVSAWRPGNQPRLWALGRAVES